MKKLAIIGLSLCCAAGAFAQGTVNFANRVTAASIYAPVYGAVEGVLQLQGNSVTNGGAINYGSAVQIGGTGFSAQLYGGPSGTASFDETHLVPGSRSPFRTNANLLGIIVGPTTGLAVPNTAIGAAASFQIRAWDNRGGTITTWAQVMGDDTIARGASAVFTPPGSLGGAGAAPLNLVGLTSFNLFTPVPEPSVIALGVLGLGALLLRRRK